MTAAELSDNASRSNGNDFQGAFKDIKTSSTKTSLAALHFPMECTS